MKAKFNAKQIANRRGKTVTPAEHKLVRDFAARCMRELSRARYELPPLTAPIEVRTKNSGQRSNAGKRGICVDVGRYRQGATEYREYPSFDSDPLIGGLQGVEPIQCLRLVVAHEVAHHVQDAYRQSMPAHMPDDLSRSHGEGWKRLYRWLRVELVNTPATEEVGNV